MFSVNIAYGSDEPRFVTLNALHIEAITKNTTSPNLVDIYMISGERWTSNEPYTDVVNKWRNELYD